MLFCSSHVLSNELPLGKASNFGAYVFGDFISGSGNSDGAIAAGGDL